MNFLHNLSLKRKIAFAFCAVLVCAVLVTAAVLSFGIVPNAGNKGGSHSKTETPATQTDSPAATPYRNYTGSPTVTPYGEEGNYAVIYDGKTTVGDLKDNLIVESDGFTLLPEEYVVLINGNALGDGAVVPAVADFVYVTVEVCGRTSQSVSVDVKDVNEIPEYTSVTATVNGQLTDDLNERTVKRFLTVKGKFNTTVDGEIVEQEQLIANRELYSVLDFSTGGSSFTVKCGEVNVTVDATFTRAQMTGASLLVKTEGYRRPDVNADKYEWLVDGKWYSAFVTGGGIIPTRADVFKHLNIYALYPNSARLLNVTDYNSTTVVNNVKDTEGEGNYTVNFSGASSFEGANNKTLSISVNNINCALSLLFEERSITGIVVDGNNQGDNVLYPYSSNFTSYFNGCVFPIYNNGEQGNALDAGLYTVSGSLAPSADYLLTSPAGGKYLKEVTVTLNNSTISAKGKLTVTWQAIKELYSDRISNVNTTPPSQTMRAEVNLEGLYATLS